MYTINMVFATAEKALKPKNESVKIVAWIYVGILSVMLILQLYAFEDFIPLIFTNYVPNRVYAAADLIAGIIVFTELFALPFLLRMQLSPLMRWFSMVCSLLAGVIWTKLSLEAVITMVNASNSGLLGVKIPIPTGWFAIVLSLALVALAMYSAWGLWPARKK